MSQQKASKNNTDLELTPAQMESAREVANVMKNQFESDKKVVENDQYAFDTMLLATTYSDPTSVDEDDEANNDTDEKKDGGSGGSGGGNKKKSNMSDLWDSFKSAAKETSEWAHEFLSQLEAAPIKIDTKKKIAAVCRKYKDLLQDTSLKLQKYRNQVEKMINCFDNVVNVMVPPADIKEDLMKLSEDDRITEVNKFATENKEELKKRLDILSSLLNDKKSIEELYKLKDTWSDLSEDIENVLTQVDKDLQEFRKKMGIIMGIAFVFVAVIGAVAIVASGGTAAAAIAPIVGTLGTYTVGAIAALSVVGVAVLGIAMIVEPEIAKVLKLTKNDTMDSIQQGLDHIATQASKMEQMLFFIYKQWVEVQSSDPSDEMSVVWGRVNCDRLLKQMSTTQQGLKILVEEIKGTEAVCNEELVNYTEKVYKPLLDMFK